MLVGKNSFACRKTPSLISKTADSGRRGYHLSIFGFAFQLLKDLTLHEIYRSLEKEVYYLLQHSA